MAVVVASTSNNVENFGNSRNNIATTPKLLILISHLIKHPPLWESLSLTYL